MATCIYCPADADAREHWLPRSLGTFRNFTYLTDRLCEQCNIELGTTVDHEFARTGPTGIGRHEYGVTGRHDKTVNPFLFRTMGATPPTTGRMPPADEEDGPYVLAEVVQDGGKPIMRPIRQIVMRRPDGTLEPVAVPKGWGVDQLRTALSERLIGDDAVLQSIYVPDESEDSNSEAPEGIRRLLTDVFGMFQATVRIGLSSTVTPPRPITIESNLTHMYFRGLAKTAFHYLLWASPLVSGRELELSPIRDFIRQGRGDVREFIRPIRQSFIPQIAAGWRPNHVSHFIAASIDERTVSGALHFFVAPAFTVNLGPSPMRTIGSANYCHQAMYFDEPDGTGHDGELQEIEAMRRRVVGPR